MVTTMLTQLKVAPALVNFIPALAYLLSLALPAAFTQPGPTF